VKPLLSGLAVGVVCLVLLAALMAAWESTEAAVAQGAEPRSLQVPAAPRVANGELDVRAAGPDLAKTVDGFAAGRSAAWVGYVVDGVPGDDWAGDDYGGGRCGTVYLEGRRTGGSDAARAAAVATPQPRAILLRLSDGAVQKIRVTAADCDLDAGGLIVHWLTGADAAQSVALLSRYVKVPEGSTANQAPSWNSALSALALHAVPAATRALERFVAAGQQAAIRKRAAFWIGSTRGAEGFATLRRYAEADADDGFRKELPFALSVSGDPGAVDVLIRMARNDLNSEVRRQAIFWLGQKAGKKVAGTLADAASSDPESSIKERAVFALSRLPNGEGVNKLIEVAQTNRDLAVRKRAIFWLAQSNDPRALEYISSVLTRK
jgi:HEAT repeat protein